MGPGLFDSVPFSDGAKAKSQEIVANAYDLLRSLEACPGSPERTLAIRKLEECVMWANKNLSRNQ